MSVYAHASSHTLQHMLNTYACMYPHTQGADIFVALMVRQWMDNEQYVVQRDSVARDAVHNHCRAFMKLLNVANFTCDVTW